MKSLEIVNENLEKGDIITIVTKDYHLITKEQLETIKKDLKVLEIIRKHLYIHTSYGDSDYGEYEDKSICINEIHECFCKEDFNKIKQWLETNKAGDYND